jgi:hypothetical protein
LAKEYSVPAADAGTSRKMELMNTRVVLVAAIDSLGDTRECQRLQRERLARGAVR